MYPGTYDWTGFFIFMAVLVLAVLTLIFAGIGLAIRRRSERRGEALDDKFRSKQISDPDYDPTEAFLHSKCRETHPE